MSDTPAQRRGQFPLRELFLLVTALCLWFGIGYYAGIVWIPLSLILAGPALYLLSQRWQIYGLEVAAIVVTLTIPIWLTILF